MRLVKPDGKTFGHITLHARMALLNYARCDTLIPELVPSPEIHYKVNLTQKIGGVNFALCDGGANDCIKGNDMRVLCYNGDGRRVSIGIASDHQLTGARLCTAVSIVETNQGFVKLIWHQCAEVNTQTNSIISNFQVRSYGILVNDVNIAHGGKQMMSTPDRTMISIVYKGGLPYTQRYYQTDKQMLEITREEITTSPGEWNLSLLEDAPNAS